MAYAGRAAGPGRSRPRPRRRPPPPRRALGPAAPGRVGQIPLRAWWPRSFGPPKGVTDCLAGIDAKLTGAEFLAPRLLSMRGVAEARQGRIDAAKADLAQMQSLKASDKFAAERLRPRAGAAGRADGRRGAGPRGLRAAARLRAAERPAAGRALQRRRQPGHRRARAPAGVGASARRAWRTSVVRTQRGAGLLAVLLVAVAIAALIWQRRSARGLQDRPAAGRGGQPLEDRVPGQHEPRDPHAAERRRRGGRHARRLGPSRARAEDGGDHPQLRPVAGAAAVRRARSGPRRGRPADHRGRALPRRATWSARSPSSAACRADEKGLALTTEIDPELERWFCGDAVRVRQILTNFASNAVKFTERGAGDDPRRSAGARPAALLGRRHRRRLQRRGEGAAVRPLPAGRRLDHPAIRRQRARPRDLAPARLADGRRRGLRKRARRRLALLVRGAVRLGGGAAGRRAPRRRGRGGGRAGPPGPRAGGRRPRHQPARRAHDARAVRHRGGGGGRRRAGARGGRSASASTRC